MCDDDTHIAVSAFPPIGGVSARPNIRAPVLVTCAVPPVVPLVLHTPHLSVVLTGCSCGSAKTVHIAVVVVVIVVVVVVLFVVQVVLLAMTSPGTQKSNNSGKFWVVDATGMMQSTLIRHAAGVL